MRTQTLTGRSRRAKLSEDHAGLAAQMSKLLIGQSDAIETIVPYVEMHQAGLAPEGRPIGVVLLLGPTGTGKTRTVEALAEVLHGSSKNLLRVDCGEFQMEHEVAKLIGAPPGYLGHRETQPMLTQSKLNSLASDGCDVSLVLFDEIEKAAPSMTRLLLGILDKATLRLGDNTTVNFERTLIFLTSNLGAKAMQRVNRPDFGFEAFLPAKENEDFSRLQSIGMAALRNKFSPEFVNRIDSVITYKALDRDACEIILDHILSNFARLIHQRLGIRGISFAVHNRRPEPASRSGRKRRVRCARTQAHGAAQLYSTRCRPVRAQPNTTRQHRHPGCQGRRIQHPPSGID